MNALLPPSTQNGGAPIRQYAAGHRGQIALLLQKNGIEPWLDRIADLLKAEDARPEQPVSLAEIAAQ